MAAYRAGSKEAGGGMVSSEPFTSWVPYIFWDRKYSRSNGIMSQGLKCLSLVQIGIAQASLTTQQCQL